MAADNIGAIEERADYPRTACGECNIPQASRRLPNRSMCSGVQTSGNRFDAPDGEYQVRYFSSAQVGCFAETLAPLPTQSRRIAAPGRERMG